MSLVLVTGPVTQPISLTEIKDHLRITTTDEDAVLQGYIEAATAEVDGRAGALQQALIDQTWDYTIDEFPQLSGARATRKGAITLPLPPLKSVTSITYTDLAGAQQTLSASLYQVLNVGSRLPGQIMPVFGQEWPDTRDDPAAVTIRYVAGYGSTSSAVPASIRNKLKRLIGDMYIHRESIGMDGQFVSMRVDELFSSERSVSFA